MLILSALSWVQSFEGITTLSFGGLTIGTMMAFGVYVWKSGSKIKGVKDLVQVAKESKEMLQEQKQETQFYKELNAEKDFELEQQKKITELLLKGISIIIAASGGIHEVSKIELLDEIKKTRDDIKKQIEIKSKEISEKAKEEVREVGTKVLEKIIKETSNISEKYSKK